MLILKHIINNARLLHLQYTFPRLTETNQSFVLGLAEGLRQAQRKTGFVIPGNGEDKSEQQTGFHLAKNKKSGA
ncbi:MAG: hypothetical protein FWC24_01180 [Treponema sp.]|nr:hypothetical protein [Treponema sp.]